MNDVTAAVTPAAAAPPAAPATPLTPSEAASKLVALRDDPAWGERVIKNDPSAVAEMHTLAKLVSEGNDLDALVIAAQDAPDTSANGELSLRKVGGEIPALRAAGISDGAILELLGNRIPTPAEIDAVSRFQKMRHGDQAWVTKYLAGDFDARREGMLMSMVLMMRPT